MWEDLGEDAVYALMDTEGALSKTNNAMEKMDAAAYDTLESSLSQLGRTVKAEVVQPIAEKLIPVAKDGVDFVTSKVAPAVDWVLNNLPMIGVIIGGVTAAVAAFKIAAWSAKLATEGFTIATKLQAIAQGALNTVMNANPIGLIILAVTALVAAFMYLWNNCEGFRNFWINLWEKIKAAVSVAVDWIKGCWEKIKAFFTGDNPIARYFQMGWNNIKIIWDVVVSYFKTIWENIKLVFSAVKSVFQGNFSDAWNAVKQIFANWGSFFSKLWNSVKQIFANVSGFFSNIFTSAKNAIANAFSSVYEKLTSPFIKARDAIKSVADKIKGFFSGKISMPKIKMPHFGISPSGWKIGDLLQGSIPKLSIQWYKEGGIMTQPTVFGASGNTLLAGGEAGAEAIVPLKMLWDKLDTLIRSVFNSASSTGEPSGEGLTSKAGELLTLDNFSLGSLADGTNVVIYYDFSNFTWSPQIQNGGTGNDEDDLMARLKAHEAEFFDWLEEFIQMREVAQYA
jgi:phage-related protein